MRNILMVFSLFVEVAIIVLFARHYAIKDKEERELILLLEDGDYPSCSYALGKITELGIKDAIPRIVKFLNTDERIRAEAAISLSELGAREHIPELMVWLGKDEEYSCYIALALAKLGADEAIPEITKLLKQEVKEIKRFAGSGYWICGNTLPSYWQALNMLGVSDEDIKIILN